MEAVPTLCQCGCGIEVLPPALWKRGHAGLAKIRKDWGPHWYTVEDRGYTTPCWIWNGYKGKGGYGITRWRGQSRGAHIRSWIEHGNEYDPDLELDHLCCQPPCVNPDHLDLVTPAVNARRSRATKLTVEQVREIRARYTGAYGEQSVLAREFGVRTGTIRFILAGHTWKGV